MIIGMLKKLVNPGKTLINVATNDTITLHTTTVMHDLQRYASSILENYNVILEKDSYNLLKAVKCCGYQ